MMPVVPAFGGHVPDGLLRFYPKTNVIRLTSQNQFNSIAHTFTHIPIYFLHIYLYILNPTEPSFKVRL